MEYKRLEQSLIDIVKEERVRPVHRLSGHVREKTLSDKNQAWTTGISFQSAGASMHEFC